MLERALCDAERTCSDSCDDSDSSNVLCVLEHAGHVTRALEAASTLRFSHSTVIVRARTTEALKAAIRNRDLDARNLGLVLLDAYVSTVNADNAADNACAYADGRELLCFALCRWNNKVEGDKIVQRLLASDVVAASAGDADARGLRPLMIACQNTISVVRTLLACKRVRDTAGACVSGVGSALMQAVLRKRPDVVSELLACEQVRATANATTTGYRRTALIRKAAIRHSCTSFARLMCPHAKSPLRRAWRLSWRARKSFKLPGMPTF